MEGTQNVSNFNSIYRVFKIGDGDGGEGETIILLSKLFG
jgi:hypothetical protein